MQTKRFQQRVNGHQHSDKLALFLAAILVFWIVAAEAAAPDGITLNDVQSGSY